MTRPGSRSRHMVITVATATGKVVKVVDENGRKATRVSLKKLDRTYKSRNGLKYVGTILHSHSSPGCAYFIISGWAVQICF
jgi:hypothetical protein